MICDWCLLIMSWTSETINIRVSCIRSIHKSCNRWKQPDQTFQILTFAYYNLACFEHKLHQWDKNCCVPVTYQTKILNIWLTNSNEFPKQGNTLRNHFFLSIKMHDLWRRLEHIKPQSSVFAVSWAMFVFESAGSWCTWTATLGATLETFTEPLLACLLFFFWKSAWLTEVM